MKKKPKLTAKKFGGLMNAVTKRVKPLHVMLRCQCLDQDGKQCGQLATRRLNYHGDSELYRSFENQPSWVRILVCEKHYKILM